VVLETRAVQRPLSQSINWTENRPSGQQHFECKPRWLSFCRLAKKKAGFDGLSCEKRNLDNSSLAEIISVDATVLSG
jgi:hypothetical protein